MANLTILLFVVVVFVFGETIEEEGAVVVVVVCFIVVFSVRDEDRSVVFGIPLGDGESSLDFEDATSGLRRFLSLSILICSNFLLILVLSSFLMAIPPAYSRC